MRYQANQEKRGGFVAKADRFGGKRDHTGRKCAKLGITLYASQNKN